MIQIISAILAVAFGAFAIWSAVRYFNQADAAKRKSFAMRNCFSLTVALLAYPLSFGPVFWIRARIAPPPNIGLVSESLETVYWPLGELSAVGPGAIKNALT